jgi:hypothetical protein
VWAAVDNREVVRIDPESGEVGSDSVPVPEVFAVTADDGFVWALSASDELPGSPRTRSRRPPRRGRCAARSTSRSASAQCG